LAKLDKLVDGLVSMTKKRTETFLYLEKKFKTDFAGLVYVSIDRIQHLVYGLVEDYLLEKDLNKEEEKIARKALKIYEAVDDGIGEIVELVREDDLLLVASDHGFRKANRWVNLNQVFVDEGLVKVDSKSVIISRVYGLLKKLGIDSFVRDKGLRLIYLIRNFRKKTDKSNFAKSVEESQSIKSSIDYNRSKLVVGESGEQGVYLLDISVKNKVKKILEGLVDEDLGIKPIRGVYLKEDLYSGKALDRAPDILIDMAEPYQIKSSKLMAGPIFEDNSWRYGGYHRQEGIYIISRSFIDRQNSKRNSIWQLLAKVIDNFK
jgi:predicted AlkP superfamily phosphohydrolase/phosphomutase